MFSPIGNLSKGLYYARQDGCFSKKNKCSLSSIGQNFLYLPYNHEQNGTGLRLFVTKFVIHKRWIVPKRYRFHLKIQLATE